MAEYMTEQEASAYVRVASSTLKSKRSKGQGPKCQRAGGRIIYSKAELDSWIRSGLL